MQIETPDGARISPRFRAYDDRGRVVSYREQDGSDPSFGRLHIFHWQGDRLESEELAHLDDPAHPVVFRRWTHTYTADGCVETVERRSVPDDGRITSTVVVHRDAAGHVRERRLVPATSSATSSRDTYDYEGNRLVGHVREATGNATSSTRFEYDDRGRVVAIISDFESDGRADSMTRFAYECPASGPGGNPVTK